MIKNAESQAQSAWTKQNRVSVCSPNAPSEAGSRGIGGQSRDLSLGTAREVGEEAAIAFQITQAITGKILARLIDRAQQRLDEAEECLTWYERQKLQARSELDELEAMVSDLQAIEASEKSDS